MRTNSNINIIGGFVKLLAEAKICNLFLVIYIIKKEGDRR